MDLIQMGLSNNEYRKDAVISFCHKYTDDGVWHRGTWYGGTWLDGVWLNGKWEEGYWKSGLWVDGTWVNGGWYGGVWLNGKFESGVTGKNFMYAELKVSPKSFFKPNRTLSLNHAKYKNN